MQNMPKRLSKFTEKTAEGMKYINPNPEESGILDITLVHDLTSK